jgi:hypothetical protein
MAKALVLVQSYVDYSNSTKRGPVRFSADMNGTKSDKESWSNLR